MRNAIRGLAAGLAVLAACGVLAMMTITAVDVFKRAVTGRSLAGAQEVAESLIVAVVYLGIAWAQYRREHVATDVLTRRLAERAASAVRLLGRLIVLGIAGWMLWRTGLGAWESFTSGELRFGLLQVPMWPARMTIPIGLLAFVLIVLVETWDQFRLLATGSAPAEPVRPHPLG